MFGLDTTTILASSGSALVARLTTHPLDTLRVRIQTHEGKTTPSLRQLIPKPWTGLYAGLPVALAFNVPGSCFYLTTYEACKSRLSQYLNSKRSDGQPPSLLAQAPLIVSAALGAELASGAIWTPMDVVKQRLQTGKESTKSAPALIRTIWKEEGYRGVWRGYFFSLAQFGPYVSIYWLAYEALKTRYIPGYTPSEGTVKADQHPILSTMTLRYTACSMAACALSVVCTNPVDIVQTRWQTSGGKITSEGLTESRAGTLPDIVKNLWRTSGPKGFMRGVGVRIIYSVPANAIGMTTYESLKKLIGARSSGKASEETTST